MQISFYVYVYVYFQIAWDRVDVSVFLIIRREFLNKDFWLQNSKIYFNITVGQVKLGKIFELQIGTICFVGIPKSDVIGLRTNLIASDGVEIPLMMRGKKRANTVWDIT